MCRGLAGEEDSSPNYVLSHLYTAQLYMQIVSSLFVSVDDTMYLYNAVFVCISAIPLSLSWARQGCLSDFLE